MARRDRTRRSLRKLLPQPQPKLQRRQRYMTEPRAMDYYRHLFPANIIAKQCGRILVSAKLGFQIFYRRRMTLFAPVDYWSHNMSIGWLEMIKC